MDNYFENMQVCDKEEQNDLFIPFSRFVDKDPYENPNNLNKSNEKYFNFSRTYCDKCVLTIIAESDEDKQTFSYSFHNPADIDLEIFCLDMEDRIACYMDVYNPGPNNVYIYSEKDLFEVNYNSDGVILNLNNYR